MLRPGGGSGCWSTCDPIAAGAREVQDWIQPAWTRLAGGCRPNRDTERTVEAAGFAIDPATRRAQGNLRRLVARIAPVTAFRPRDLTARGILAPRHGHFGRAASFRRPGRRTVSSRTSASGSRGRAGPTRPPAPAGGTAPTSRTCRTSCEHWRTRYDWRDAGGAAQRLPPVHGPARGHRPPFHPRARARARSRCHSCCPTAGRARCSSSIELIPLLTDPARFGADPADAFTVVAPSLPGYGFSFRAGPAALRASPEIAATLRRADDATCSATRASARRAATGGRS